MAFDKLDFEDLEAFLIILRVLKELGMPSIWGPLTPNPPSVVPDGCANRRYIRSSVCHSSAGRPVARRVAKYKSRNEIFELMFYDSHNSYFERRRAIWITNESHCRVLAPPPVFLFNISQSQNVRCHETPKATICN